MISPVSHGGGGPNFEHCLSSSLIEEHCRLLVGVQTPNSRQVSPLSGSSPSPSSIIFVASYGWLGLSTVAVCVSLLHGRSNLSKFRVVPPEDDVSFDTEQIYAASFVLKWCTNAITYLSYPHPVISPGAFRQPGSPPRSDYPRHFLVLMQQCCDSPGDNRHGSPCPRSMKTSGDIPSMVNH